MGTEEARGEVLAQSGRRQQVNCTEVERAGFTNDEKTALQGKQRRVKSKFRTLNQLHKYVQDILCFFP